MPGSCPAIAHIYSTGKLSEKNHPSVVSSFKTTTTTTKNTSDKTTKIRYIQL